MSIPDYESVMLPLLRFAGDQREHSLRETREVLAKQFDLSEAQLNEMLPSGQTTVWANRVGWAKTYLNQAGLLELVKRGVFRITSRGLQVLAEEPSAIDQHFLRRFPEFEDFRSRRRTPGDADQPDERATKADKAETPMEVLERSYENIRSALANDLLSQVKEASPAFFEILVVELLIRMGYGGSRREAGKALGRTGDEGIDGTINEDRLGLDVVYIQAKRWEGTVGRPDVQKFVGALHGKRARKGVFLTTGSFSQEAREYTAHIDPKVVLIDGEQLAEYMIDFGVGVTSVAMYEVKRVDGDYFAEE